MRLLKLLIVFLFSMTLSACSPFGNNNKVITLRYWGLFDSAATINQIIEDYKKVRPNVNIYYEKKSKEQYRETLQTQIRSGKGPDVFQFHNTWTLMLENELAWAPDSVISSADLKQKYYPTVSENLRNRSKKIIGLPLGIDGLGLYYNEDLFQAAGISKPPATWQEFAQIAAKLTVKDTAGNIRTSGASIGTANNVDNFSDILGLMILQNGGDLRNPVNQRSFDALEFYTSFVKGQDRIWDETMPSSTLAFAGGNLAMFFGPSTKAAEIKNTNPLLRFKVAPVPQLEGGKAGWASYWAVGVSSKMKDKKKLEEAWSFIKYLQEDQTLVKVYSEASKAPSRFIGMPYPKVSLAQKLASDSIVGAYITDAPYMRSFPMAGQTADNGLNDQIIKAWEEAVKAVVSGSPPNRALEAVSKSTQEIFAKYSVPVQK